jgi:hypothetical protein
MASVKPSLKIDAVTHGPFILDIWPIKRPVAQAVRYRSTGSRVGYSPTVDVKIADGVRPFRNSHPAQQPSRKVNIATKISEREWKS